MGFKLEKKSLKARKSYNVAFRVVKKNTDKFSLFTHVPSNQTLKRKKENENYVKMWLFDETTISTVLIWFEIFLFSNLSKRPKRPRNHKSHLCFVWEAEGSAPYFGKREQRMDGNKMRKIITQIKINNLSATRCFFTFAAKLDG